MHAVEQLGVDQAIPSRILELMKVEGLTRHNVASHLQVGVLVHPLFSMSLYEIEYFHSERIVFIDYVH